MEVSRPEDKVTHAVIGGSQSQEFGISNSAEFFQILSSTLYTDQKLAVVREDLCNAWDAHIEAGKTGTAIEITLNEKEFVIRDFGNGIPDDKIIPIYAVYGNSTKKNDGKQTGGFGLGCKAPFAYADHFQVTSIHNGTKSIYTMSKSSGVIGGKPGVTKIASFPSQEPSGLEVRIPVNSRDDMNEFRSDIITVVRNGEMKANLNGKELWVLPFSSMQHGFLITDELVNTSARVLVRYGNVIYPIPDHADYSGVFKRMLNILNKFSGSSYYSNNSNHRLILQAPPHSIAVTPSRETLSMQEHTINTLSKLINNFVSLVENDIHQESYASMRSSVASAVQKKDYSSLMSSNMKIAGLSETELASEKVVITTNAIAKHTVMRQYPNYRGFRKEEIKLRVLSMLKQGLVDRGLAQTFLDAYDAEPENKRDRWNGNTYGDPKSWFLRRVIGGIERKMRDNTELSLNRLLVYGYGLDDASQYGSSYDTIEASKAPRIAMENLLPYLRKVVVLSYTRANLTNRLREHEDLLALGYRAANILVYVVPRTSAKKTQAARDFFQKLGYSIADMTIVNTWENADVLGVTTKTIVKKPKKKGLAKMSEGISASGILYLQDLRDNDTCERIEDPQWITRLPTQNREKRYDQEVGMFDITQTKIIIQLWGNVGGAVQTDKQFEAYEAKGAKTVDEFVKNKVLSEMESNARIHEYLKFARWRAFPANVRHGRSTEDVAREFSGIVYGNPDLAKEFGIVNNLTKEDKQIVLLYRALLSNQYWLEKKFPELKAVMDNISTIALDNGVIRLRALCFENREALEFLDADKISLAIQNSDADKRDRAMKMFRLALNI